MFLLKGLYLHFKNKFFSFTPKQVMKDILAGIITAMISIPISMGYAQVAGLPMQYGLYGSVFPILLFGLITSSRDFVFGVDAAPAALVGGTLASLGIAAGSDDATAAVPTIALLCGCWLLLFYFIKAGRIVKYISEPVMGGFVTGICCTIILMQTPKLFGGGAGMGEAPELITHIIGEIGNFNLPSLIMGIVTITLIMAGKKFIPKIPVSVIVMVLGAASTFILPLNEWQVKMLPETETGFPGFIIPSGIASPELIGDLLFPSLSISAVILAESLLASRGNALKDGYSLDNNREILAYSAANFAGAFSGCCPINGSVSRTGIVRQSGAASQWLSISAAGAMLAVLYLAAGGIKYLPVPVLTAIVVSALINASEFHAARRLWKTSRSEFFIFIAAMGGVLIFGTVYGVMIGIVLSFMEVIIRAVTPPRSFMGVIPGKDGFFSLERNSAANPVKGAVIYRFGGNIFFANIDTLQNDIANAVKEDTRVIIINAGAVGRIDITAADRLLLMYRSYEQRGIKLYITEHLGEVNDMLRRFGAGELLLRGCVRMTTALALRASGFRYPYQTESVKIKSSSDGRRSMRYIRSGDIYSDRASKGIQAELEWAFGKTAESHKEEMVNELLEMIDSMELSDSGIELALQQTYWGRINLFDEDELIDRLEMRLFNLRDTDSKKSSRIEKFLEERRSHIEKRMLEMDPQILTRIKKNRLQYGKALKESDPQAYGHLMQSRKEYISRLRITDPELAEKYSGYYSDISDERSL